MATLIEYQLNDDPEIVRPLEFQPLDLSKLYVDGPNGFMNSITLARCVWHGALMRDTKQKFIGFSDDNQTIPTVWYRNDNRAINNICTRKELRHLTIVALRCICRHEHVDPDRLDALQALLMIFAYVGVNPYLRAYWPALLDYPEALQFIAAWTHGDLVRVDDSEKTELCQL